jgi:hypothetical protein
VDQLNLTAPVELTAADGPARPARISILAYGGGVMQPAGWPKLVIDLARLQLGAAVPLLADHESRLDRVAGVGTPAVDRGRLTVSGTLAPGPAGELVKALAAAGVPLQASVGVRPDPEKVTRLRPGESIAVNGRTITAGPEGLSVINAGSLQEVSILPLGADPSTSVTVTATSKGTMSTTATNPPADAIDATPDPIAAERSRVREIRQLCASDAGGDPARLRDIEGKAIDEGWTVEQVRASYLDLMRASRPAAPHVSKTGGDGTTLATLEASLLLRAGRDELAVRSYGQRTAEDARRLRFSSMLDLCASAMRIEGRDPAGLSRSELIQASFSTLSLPTALSNVMGKSLMDAYLEATPSWRGFAAVKPAADFKPQTGIRPSFVGELEQLAPHGEITHGTLDESTFPWQIDTYAKIFTVDRKTVINDDLGFIDETPRLMANAAARKLNDLIWSLIMDGSASFFTLGNGNLIDLVLGESGLSQAVAAMRSKRDAEGNDLQIAPAVLAVAPEKEFTARALVNSSEVGRTDGGPTGNALKGIAEVAVESRLSNTGKFANAAPEAWYLFGGPMATPLIVGFLDGRQAPVVETFGLDHQPNKLALSFRCYHDFGAALGDHRAALKSDGTP